MSVLLPALAAVVLLTAATTADGLEGAVTTAATLGVCALVWALAPVVVSWAG